MCALSLQAWLEAMDFPRLLPGAGSARARRRGGDAPSSREDFEAFCGVGAVTAFERSLADPGEGAAPFRPGRGALGD